MEDRTAELAQINLKLEQEIEERKRAEKHCAEGKKNSRPSPIIWKRSTRP